MWLKNILITATILALVGPGFRAEGSQISIANFGASGSDVLAKGSTTAGSNEVELSSPADFRNQQGIVLYHAGAPCSIGGIPCGRVIPEAPIIRGCPYAPKGAPGNTEYRYRVAYVDEKGGLTSAGPPAAFPNGPDQISAINCVTVFSKKLSGVGAYAIYRSVGGSPFQLVAITLGNTRGAASGPGNILGYISYPDSGVNLARSRTVPSTPPSSPLPENLVTRVRSGGRTARLGLEDAAGQSTDRVTVGHDDGTAIEAAFKAAAGKRARLLIPAGIYVVDREIFVPAFTEVVGEGQRSILTRADFYYGNLLQLERGGRGISLENFVYDGNGLAFNGPLDAFIWLSGTVGTRIEGLTVRNVSDKPLDGPASHLSVIGNTFIDSWWRGAIYAHNADHIVVMNNRLNNISDDCIDPVNIDDGVISGNIANCDGRNKVVNDAIQVEMGDRVRIIDNQLYSATGRALTIVQGDSQRVQASGYVISGNTIRSGGRMPAVSFSTTSGVVFENNRVVGAVVTSPLGHDFRIANNQIQGPIVLQGNGQLTGNEASKIVIRSDSQAISSVLIQGNTLNGSGPAAVQVSSPGGRFSISGIKVSGNALTGSFARPLQIQGPPGRIVGLSVSGNR